MRVRGQGAMEYLMSYGWAIVLVAVLGAALWQFGVFKGVFGFSATSSGFSVLKPVMASCDVRGDVWSGGGFSQSGFFCSFTNSGGESIVIDDVVLSVDDPRYPGAVIVSKPDDPRYVLKVCASPDGPCTGLFNSSGVPSNLTVAAGGVFNVIAVSNGAEYPLSVIRSEPYTVHVTIFWSGNSLGTRVRRADSGFVHVMGEPGGWLPAANGTSTTSPTSSTESSTTLTIPGGPCGNGVCGDGERCVTVQGGSPYCAKMGDPQCNAYEGGGTTSCPSDKFCCHSFYGSPTCCGEGEKCCASVSAPICCGSGQKCAISWGGHDAGCCDMDQTVCGYYDMGCCDPGQTCCDFAIPGYTVLGTSHCCGPGQTCCAKLGWDNILLDPVTCCDAGQTCDINTGSCV